MRFASLVAATALVAVSGPVLAADLGSPEPLPMPAAPVAAAPANDWTGFYLGALLGYTFGSAETTAADVDIDGLDGGAYAGVNYQFNNFVLGAEGDIIISGVDGDDAGISVDQGLNGSLRARAGIALDQFLLYGTGGVAVTKAELADTTGSEDQMLWGWTVGVGGEAMIMPNVTARVEYRYTDYQNETFDLGAGPVDSDLTTNSVRAGVGVKF
jgi:outer membrane immunogenic protein